MLAIVAGGVVLSWAGRPEAGVPWGPLAVAGACLCWALDNNLTRQVSAADPVQIAAAKGLVAGAVNTGIAFANGATVPEVPAILGAAGVGFVGYGVSLACFVLALRHLGTARTGAYFSTAPFVGAVVSLVVFREGVSWPLAVAGALMGLGVYLHLTEVHDHEHEHEEMDHEHAHVHDEHHQHAHGADDPPGEPHTHPHHHPAMRHAHPHYPDSHHRHEH
jgi:drug/metabolite transporter (DMT)-like permease